MFQSFQIYLIQILKLYTLRSLKLCPWNAPSGQRFLIVSLKSVGAAVPFYCLKSPHLFIFLFWPFVSFELLVFRLLNSTVIWDAASINDAFLCSLLTTTMSSLFAISSLLVWEVGSPTGSQLCRSTTHFEFITKDMNVFYQIFLCPEQCSLRNE